MVTFAQLLLLVIPLRFVVGQEGVVVQWVGARHGVVTVEACAAVMRVVCINTRLQTFKGKISKGICSNVGTGFFY